MSRRRVKEYRPDEALSLVSADREGKPLSCPSCGSESVVRKPPRVKSAGHQGRIRLACSGCGRLASYLDGAGPPIR